jgi:hypothetical protein
MNKSEIRLRIVETFSMASITLWDKVYDWVVSVELEEEQKRKEEAEKQRLEYEKNNPKPVDPISERERMIQEYKNKKS